MMSSCGELIGVSSLGDFDHDSGYGAVYPILDWIDGYAPPPWTNNPDPS